MKQLILATLFLIASSIIYTVNGQVTIGSKQLPNLGALLDLKEFDPPQTDIGGVTSTRGLMLPRVQLKADNLIHLGITADADTHTGLLIYNVGMEAGFCPGLHVWDGNNWQPLTNMFEDKPADLLRADGTGEIWDHEGKKYAVGKFGDDWWMTENLATETSIRNCGKALTYSIPGGQDKATAIQSKHGLLYQWSVAIDGDNSYDIINSSNSGIKQSATQGICPKGWVLPSDLDWNILEKEISKNPNLYSKHSTPINWMLDYEHHTGLWYRPMIIDADFAWGTCMVSQSLVNGKDPLGVSFAAEARGLDVLLVGTGSTTTFGVSTTLLASTKSTYSLQLGSVTRQLNTSKNNSKDFYGVYRGTASGNMSVRCKKE